jgi:hypothetical protein
MTVVTLRSFLQMDDECSCMDIDIDRPEETVGSEEQPQETYG